MLECEGGMWSGCLWFAAYDQLPMSMPSAQLRYNAFKTHHPVRSSSKFYITTIHNRHPGEQQPCHYPHVHTFLSEHDLYSMQTHHVDSP